MAIFNFSYIVNFVEDAVQLLSKGVNFVPYRLVWPEFIISTDEPVQKHPWFVSLKIPVLNELHWTYRWILDILAEKWKLGGTKNLKKMEKVSSKKLTMPSSLDIFPCCRPFPSLHPSVLSSHFSFFFFFFFFNFDRDWISLVVPFVLVVCVCVRVGRGRGGGDLLFNCLVWVLPPHVNSNEFKFQIYLDF